ncbi:copper amine oxidase N-terminal domain-containing protein [Paenibacillus antarcticus]|uniref:Copper amine oxidase-like N-terminal domain-containing protein n=1 Tax=Paenibacillus antarcticus TaxID=253703 RepID=A0A168NHE4_9BACL|nr:copper amine oxidase N-terminal domain-containing protein [Paenibacillus antarcticus]OAB45800.1 hypothetical protein PBAT_12930 [Paenibacillus antarcticus]
MNKIITSLVIAILFSSIHLSGTTFAATKETPIIIDNGKISNGRTLIPIRAVSINLDFKVNWNQELKTIVITDKETTISLKVDSNKASVNGKAVTLEAPAQIIKGTTYVPLQFMSTAFGVNVKWDQSFKVAHITLEDLDILIYTMRKPIPKLTEEQFKTFSRIANEAAVITDIPYAKAQFKPYFTDKLLGNIIWYKGLPYETQFDEEKNNLITYKDIYNSEATISQVAQFVSVVWITRTMELKFTETGWKVQTIDFKYLYL